MPPQVDSQSATAAVTRRFLAAYGPATYHDLARWWGGGTVYTARQWITSLGDEVRPVDLEGTQAWMLAAHVREARELLPSRSLRLLPGFDQYMVGASWHAENLLPGDLRSRVYRPQGWISPILLVNGRMEGAWRHEVRGSRVDVTIEAVHQGAQVGSPRCRAGSRAIGRFPRLYVRPCLEDLTLGYVVLASV